MKQLFISLFTAIAALAALDGAAQVTTIGGATNKPDNTGIPGGSWGIPLPQTATGTGAPLRYNYTRTWTPLSEVATFPNQTMTATNCTIGTIYTNGWGQPVQSNLHDYRGDIVTPVDNRAMLDKPVYLPYPGAARSLFLPNAFSDQKAWYGGSYAAEGDNAYSRTKVMASGNSRSTASYGPGAALTGNSRGTLSATEVNTGSDGIRILSYESGHITVIGSYAAGDLLVQKTTGQHNALALEYTNRSGQVVCKKVAAGNNAFLYTYYVYDELGRISCIITPKAVEATNGWGFMSAVPMSLCYTYQYNKYGQVTERTIPGKTAPELSVYDPWHRPVMSQTALLRSQGKWAWQVYDSRGRVVMSGLVSSSDTRSYWQSLLDGGSAQAGTLGWYLTHECNGIAPASLPGCEINQYNYYDTYDFPAGLSISGHTAFDTRHNVHWRAGSTYPTPVPLPAAPGQLTATRTRVLDHASLPNQWISSVLFYDLKGRAIQTQTLNAWNTTAWDVTTVRTNFAGQTDLVIRDFNSPTGCTKATARSADKFLYGVDGRLAGIQHFTDESAQPVPVADYTYDGLGRVSQKRIGGIEVQDYSYDIGGRLTGINKGYTEELTIPDVTFGEQLFYDHGFGQPRYDGSLAGVIWRGAGTAAHRRSYGYLYDAAGRMTDADFYDQRLEQLTPTGGFPWTKDADYSVSGIDYDANGNMLGMTQRGMAVVGGQMQATDLDRLHYYYQPGSNALDRVEDELSPSVNEAYQRNDFINRNMNTPDYDYDADGNLTKDRNKGIETIGYNAQDLPVSVQGAGGTVANTYDAAGGLLEKRITPASGSPVVYRYLGPLVFKDNELSYGLHPEGRCRWLSDRAGYQYDYFIKDHLGNVRTIVTSAPGSPQYYVATYENSRALAEGALFDHVEEVREDNKVDPQPGDLKVALLDGSDANRRIGSSLLLRVMSGDRFDIGVDAAYEGKVAGADGGYVKGEEMVSALVGALASGAVAVPGGEGSGNAELVQGLFGGSDFLGAYQSLKSQAYDPAYPRAYLGYAFFDEHMKLVPEESGMIQVTRDAAGGGWKQIGRTGINIKGNGFFTVFTFNEDFEVPVLMNNLAVTYSRGTLLEEQHYYPHGLLASEGNANPVANRYLYQGKELQDEAGLQLYDFHARQYDPQLGRFWGIDPMDQYPSGYVGMGNSPANLVDPDGMTARWTPKETPNEPDRDEGSPNHFGVPTDTDDANLRADEKEDQPGQGDDTHLYNNETGNKLGTIKDDRPDVVSILPVNPALEANVTRAIDAINAKSQEAINNAGDFVRSLAENSTVAGTGNYDVTGFSKWFDNSYHSVKADKIGGENISGADIRYNGQKVTPYAEVSNNLRMVGNVVTVGSIPNGKYYDTRESPTSDHLADEPGKIKGVGIHSHPVAVRTNVTNMSKYGPFQNMGYYEGGFNSNERGANSGGKYRSITVDKQNVYLYGKFGTVIIIKK